MKFRALILFGAAYSTIASAPLRVRVIAAAALWVWFAVDMLIEHRRQRRAAAARVPADGYDEPPWVDCDAQWAGFPGVTGECHECKGHDGPHRAMAQLEWTGAQ